MLLIILKNPKLLIQKQRRQAKILINFKKILKLEPKIEIKVKRKKLEKLRKYFDELRHKFSNKDEISQYRKALYNAKKHKLFESEIKEVRSILHKLKKS